MLPQESTPLLTNDAESGVVETTKDGAAGDIYDHFNNRRKWSILAMVSASGLLPLFVGGSFVPSIPQIARDLDSTPTIISMAISISILASSIGAMSGATYAGYCASFLCSLPLLFIGSTGVALSRSVPSLMAWRFVQAMGCAPGLSVSAGVIGDIYRLEERGRAMSIFFSACLLGPALAPITGGFAAHYASWRVMQFILGCIGLILFAVMLRYLPETSHPGARKVDKIKMNLDATNDVDAAQNGVQKRPVRFEHPVLLNPLAPLRLLRSPVLIALVSSYFLTVLLIPLVYTLGTRYGISNEALIGACFIPAGLGDMIGAPIIGRISDMTVIRWKKKRNGVWYPEDRLRPALIPMITIVPLSCFASGLLSAYGSGRVGLALNLFCFFLNGLGTEMVWGPCAAYMVDVMHSQSAECIASNAGLRSAILAIGVSTILPMVNSWGVVATNTFASSLTIIGFLLIWSLIRYGDELRAVVDVGFSPSGSSVTP
ncbi:MFS general substrate transporter [Coprinopsis marcescibilis]|uniref:MFS general substrate transporter n=1 Tax=Coprinopsis marcescibilis TaxID=230819 RepID=A0A5C3KEX6_COPMA|nr:MFS general substrate transporter [Coprinopsis marcescibilis]